MISEVVSALSLAIDQPLLMLMIRRWLLSTGTTWRLWTRWSSRRTYRRGSGWSTGGWTRKSPTRCALSHSTKRERERERERERSDLPSILSGLLPVCPSVCSSGNLTTCACCWMVYASLPPSPPPPQTPSLSPDLAILRGRHRQESLNRTRLTNEVVQAGDGGSLRTRT
eukprot:COSAG05_NODE_7327_length_826_cov_6.684324_1_plen_169_part_00